jgi:hypothetical protein
MYPNAIDSDAKFANLELTLTPGTWVLLFLYITARLKLQGSIPGVLPASLVLIRMK